MNLFSAFLGRDHFVVAEKDLTALSNLFLSESLSFSDFRLRDGKADFWILSSDARRLIQKAEEAGIRLIRTRRRGFFSFLYAYRRRLGLILGSLCAALLLVFSFRVVWDVRIVGNETIPTKEIEEILRENGLFVGAPLKGIRSGELENRVLLSTDRISWLSVNLSGTVANVQIMESVMPPENEAKNPANLVASCDGQIEFLQLYRGKSVVKVGQAVRKGDLLVSGLTDSNREGFRYTRASGEVMARTYKEYKVTVPFAVMEKETLSSRVGELTLHFFGLSAKIYKRTGKEGEGCVIIETEKGLEGIGLLNLPLSLTVTRYEDLSEREVRRDEEEVLELAYAELKEALEEISSESLLLKKEILTEWTDEGVTLTCRIDCIQNIAEQVEFEVLP